MNVQTIQSVSISAVLTIVLVCGVHVTGAEVMSSSNFKIQEDSLNSGGLLSTSTNYTMEDTVGELATGQGTSTGYALQAGYQQMNEKYLSLSSVPDLVMSTSLPGLTGGVSTGSVAFLVTTDSSAGYSVTISAQNSPAMQSGAFTISDYTPAGAVPDFLFTTAASDAHFAFTPEGADVSLRFQDSGGVCGVAAGDTVDSCWDGLGTTPAEIVRSGASNHPLGATTTIKFAVGIGGSTAVPAGVYTATTTITALAL